MTSTTTIPAIDAPGRDGPAAARGPVPRHRYRTPRLAAALAVLAGVLNLVSALLPAERARLRVLHDLVPGAVSRGATVAVAAAGIGLLLLAGGLRRRHRTAWLATVGLLGGSAILHVVKGLDVEEALVEAFLAGLLSAKAACFPARPGRGERQAVLGPALVVTVATLAYGLLGLVANDHDVRADLGLAGMVREVGRMALGLGAGVPLTGRFGRLFPGSLAAVFWLGVLLVAARALTPMLVRRARDPGLPAAVASSDDSLAYFALRDDRATVRAGDALVAYGTVGPVALAAGDPLGPPAQWPAAVAAFCDEAATQGRITAVLGCGAEAAAAWRDAGLTTIYLGDEAVIDLRRFTLEGRGVRIARQSWNRARRAGYATTLRRAGELDRHEVSALLELSGRWRGEVAERGFSMALGRLFDPRDPAALVVVAKDAEGRLRGFLHFVPWGPDGASLNVMRRDRSAPSWLNDFLVVEAALRLPELGVRRISLNFSFLRTLLAAGAEPGVAGHLRLARWLLRRLSGPFQIESLYRFNRKFCPDWQPRYLAIEAPEELPQVALAMLRAEGLLCPPWRLRPSKPDGRGIARFSIVAHHPLHRVASGLAHVPAGLLRQVGRAGPLENPWLAVGLGALVPATVALIALRHHWRGRHAGPPRRRWLHRGALTAWVALLSVLTGLAGLNAYAGYVPTLPSLFGDLPISVGDGGRGGGSSVVSFDIGAPRLRVPPSRCYVYLPPGYDSRAQRSRRYPVVYLLHGYPGGPIDWFRGAQVQETMDAMLADRLVQPMILVAPDASGGWLHDSEMLNQVGGPQVESYLVGTVVHAVDRRFRTIADRGGRAVGGVSSGGYGALNLGLRHQDVFSVILSLMPYGTPGAVTRTLLGGSHALWLANSPAAYVPTMTFHHPMTVDLVAGDHDPEAREAARLARMLHARRQDAVFDQVHGAGHTWRGARVEAPYVLAFASGHLAGWHSTRGMA